MGILREAFLWGFSLFKVLDVHLVDLGANSVRLLSQITLNLDKMLRLVFMDTCFSYCFNPLPCGSCFSSDLAHGLFHNDFIKHQSVE